MSSVTRKKLLGPTGVYLLLSVMFTRKAMSRLLVGAFNTRGTHGLTRGGITRFSSCIHPRLLSTQGVARVDEDLDAALDNLLGSAFDDDEDDDYDDYSNADAVNKFSLPVLRNEEEVSIY